VVTVEVTDAPVAAPDRPATARAATTRSTPIHQAETIASANVKTPTQDANPAVTTEDGATHTPGATSHRDATTTVVIEATAPIEAMEDDVEAIEETVGVVTGKALMTAAAEADEMAEWVVVVVVDATDGRSLLLRRSKRSASPLQISRTSFLFWSRHVV
jgi:hypothetical protein